ncbi:hypothetical protein CUN85_11770 [Methanolobus halotolerans]|uniref:Uncharacterized protein n=1 Tax=Methanolobus halotolerans TaxID=2052935 RepID=A0A4E0PWU7_9EURY|nr:hypothetical protein CUN85_11770 [Methanolobus halotolerans]
MASVDESIDEDDFYSVSYTNPDSLEAHEMATSGEDGKHSQIQIHHKLTPRTTVSPDNNFSVYMKALSTASGMGIEEYVINNNLTGREIKIKDVSTMGYYAVAFSPDSKMYAAPKVVSCENGRNGQYVIDICSAQTNELLHREFTPFYKESSKYTPMEWDRSAIYGIYWSEDGSSLAYEVLAADVDGGNYPTTLVINRLNVNYTELREMNGYVEPVAEFSETTNVSEEQAMNSMPVEQEEENPATDEAEPVAAPGFGILIALSALAILAIGRKLNGGSR